MDATVSDLEGHFALRVRPGEDADLVAAAVGLRPTCITVSGISNSEVDVVLDAGVSIAGTVRGHDGAMLESAEILAEPSVIGENVLVGPHELVIVQGRVEWGRARASSGQDGRFRLCGLSAGRWSVRVSGVRAATGVVILEDLLQALRTEVAAPADNVEVVVSGCWMSIDTLIGGRPSPGVFVEFLGEWGGAHRSDASGRLLVLGRWDAKYEVRVAESECEPWRAEVVTGGIGGRVPVVIDLVRNKAQGVLVIGLDTPNGRPPSRAGIGVFPADDLDAQVCETQDLYSPSGKFRIRGVASGAYRIVIRGGGGWTSGTGLFVEAQVRVEVPTTGEREYWVKVREGGRLRISAKDGKGTFVGPSCVIEDLSGTAVDAIFRYRRSASEYSECKGALMDDGPNEIEPVLPPGRYRIRCSLDGYDDKVVEVDVREGRIEDVSIEMVESRDPAHK